MDLLARAALRRAAGHLDLDPDERLLDFDVGTLRPVSILPPPLQADLGTQENGRVTVVATDLALHLRIKSRSLRQGQVVRLPWDDVVWFGPYQAVGKWKKWSLRGFTVAGHPITVSIEGRPRPSMVAALAGLVPTTPDDYTSPEGEDSDS